MKTYLIDSIYKVHYGAESELFFREQNESSLQRGGNSQIDYRIILYAAYKHSGRATIYRK